MVDEIGERIAKSVVDFFNDSENILNIEKLKNVGLQFETNTVVLDSKIFDNKTFVVSGVFDNYSRNELKKTIELNGGKNLSSISSKTSYLLAGDKMGPSKKIKASEFGVKIISESELQEMIFPKNTLF